MTALEKKLDYFFRNPALLQTALTHSSYANENRRQELACNERLEFLGDAVLGLTVAEWLYRHFPDLPEGQMTKMRAELVCEQSLTGAAEELELGQYLRLGHGEELNGGRDRASILADAVEAVIAAVYLDGGDAAGLIRRLILAPAQTKMRGSHVGTDYKTALQELVQRHTGSKIAYILTDASGPDHNKLFTVSVSVNGQVRGSGTGHSKKEAEQAAARQALEQLQR